MNESMNQLNNEFINKSINYSLVNAWMNEGMTDSIHERSNPFITESWDETIHKSRPETTNERIIWLSFEYLESLTIRDWFDGF
jgi:hypothetical protein